MEHAAGLGPEERKTHVRALRRLHVKKGLERHGLDALIPDTIISW